MYHRLCKQKIRKWRNNLLVSKHLLSYFKIQIQGDSRPRRDTATPIVHVPSVQMSMKDIIHSMEKYFPHDLFKEAVEDFRKLQDIEEKIANDENLV